MMSAFFYFQNASNRFFNNCVKLLNLIRNQAYINKIKTYAKGPYRPQHKLLINKGEEISLKHLQNLQAFIKYLKNMRNVYQNTDECNPGCLMI